MKTDIDAVGDRLDSIETNQERMYLMIQMERAKKFKFTL